MIDPRRRRLLALLAAACTGWAGASLWRRRWYGREAGAEGDSLALAFANPATDRVAPVAPPPGDTRFTQPLRRFGREGLMAEVDASRPLDFRAGIANFDLFPGGPTPLWHYAAERDGHAVANPTLRIAQGQVLDVGLDNRLVQETTVHWHGLAVDEANDGSGLHAVAPGTQRRYRLSVRNRAGLYWYHAHPHGHTGLQLQRGLAGLLWVDDAEEGALRACLGLAQGERDLALMLADKQINAGNGIVYDSVEADDWIGNRVLINWTPEPYLDAVRGRYRLRIANVANARLWRLAFEHRGQALPFQLLGTDAGLLAQAWMVEEVFLGPAQRVDLLVDFSAVPAGARVRLRSLDYDPMEHDGDNGALADPMAEHPGATPMGAALDLMEFRIDGAAETAAPALPAALSALPPAPDVRGSTQRAFRLHIDARGVWRINDWNFHESGHAPVFRIKRGSREVWELRNGMRSMPHPMHLHGFSFRVLSRRDSPMAVRARAVTPEGLTPQDLGLADTVVVWPGEVVRLAIDFSQPWRGEQRYMFHCHNLEHEDRGMMVTFAVVD